MLQKWSLRTRLFAIYSLIVFLIIPLSYAIFYHYYKSMAYQTLNGSLRREATILAEQLSTIIDSADLLAINALYNPSIENWMKETSDLNNKPVLNVFNKMILGLNIDPDGFNRISIIKESGTFLTFGANYNRDQVKKKITSLTWFDDLTRTDRLVLAPHRDDWDSKGKMVVSVVRKGALGTLIEIQIPYSYLDAILSKGKYITNGKQVILYGGDRQVIHPLTPLPAPSVQEVTAEQNLRNSGWKLVVTQPIDLLLKSARETGYWMAAIAAGLSLISLAMFYFFTTKTTRPLVQLSQAMARLPGDARANAELEKLFARWDNRETHNEIVHLHRAFKDMLQRLEESKQQAVDAHSRELQAQFLALQAQMNPHFLYNTLTLIGMLGMEDGNEEIMKITSELVQMLRYISYESRELVSLKEEIDHTLRYLDIMETRYRGHLFVDVRIEGDLGKVCVPKLTVQPFLENCVKHGFEGKKYPWRIELHISVTDAGWSVHIRDDGDGFDCEYLRTFTDKQNDFKRTGLFNDQGSVGIMNTYIRLHHTFGSALQFDIGNNKAGGAFIYLGCRLTEEEDWIDQNIACG